MTTIFSQRKARHSSLRFKRYIELMISVSCAKGSNAPNSSARQSVAMACLVVESHAQVAGPSELCVGTDLHHHRNTIRTMLKMTTTTPATKRSTTLEGEDEIDAAAAPPPAAASADCTSMVSPSLCFARTGKKSNGGSNGSDFVSCSRCLCYVCLVKIDANIGERSGMTRVSTFSNHDAPQV